MKQLFKLTAPEKWQIMLIRGDKHLSSDGFTPDEIYQYQQLMEMLSQDGWKVSSVASDSEGGEQESRWDGHQDVIDYIAERVQ